jgi:adenosylcobinamide-GDP ribazoletransferase
VAVPGPERDPYADPVVDRPAPASPRPVTDLLSALGFLTVLPVGRAWPDGRQPRAVGWYPWVGWLLGGVAAGGVWLAQRLLGPFDVLRSVVAAAVVLVIWAGLTRLLHWDGLADSLDGIWGGHTPQRRLEIMRDSHIGSFGVAAIVLVAIVEFAAIAACIARGQVWVLVAAPVIARFSASLAAWELPAARPDGLGSLTVGPSGLYDRLVAGVAVLCLLALLATGVPSQSFVIATGVGIAGGMLVPRMLSREVGGMTGDLFGATILLVEALILVMGAFGL